MSEILSGKRLLLRLVRPLLKAWAAIRHAAGAEAESDRIPGSGSPRNDEKYYFRSTISIQFGCVPIG